MLHRAAKEKCTNRPPPSRAPITPHCCLFLATLLLKYLPFNYHLWTNMSRSCRNTALEFHRGAEFYPVPIQLTHRERESDLTQRVSEWSLKSLAVQFDFVTRLKLGFSLLLCFLSLTFTLVLLRMTTRFYQHIQRGLSAKTLVR